MTMHSSCSLRPGPRVCGRGGHIPVGRRDGAFDVFEQNVFALADCLHHGQMPLAKRARVRVGAARDIVNTLQTTCIYITRKTQGDSDGRKITQAGESDTAGETFAVEVISDVHAPGQMCMHGPNLIR